MTRRLKSTVTVGPILMLMALSTVSAQGAEIEAQLSEMAAKTNAKLPMHVDDSTIWEQTIAGPGKRFTMIYKLTDIAPKSDKERTAIASGMGPYRLDAIKDYCNGKLKQLASNSVTMSFQYLGSDGKLITDIVLTPNDCR